MKTLLHPDSVISLSSYFSETIFPQRLYARIFLLLVLLKASSYWFFSKLLHVKEPLSVIAMYRIGDIQYYPFISALSNLQFGENVVFEHLGKGVAAFPYVSNAPYALGLRMFGAAGFIVADIFIAMCYYVVLVILLRILGISKTLSECIGILVVSGGVDPLFAGFRYAYRMYRGFRIPLLFVLGGIVVFLGSLLLLRCYRKNRKKPLFFVRLKFAAMILLLPLSLGPVGTYIWWGWRLPRPFVTEIFSLLCIGLVRMILFYNNSFLQSKKSYLYSFFLGISFAALLQGDVYLAENTLIAMFLLTGLSLFTNPRIREVWIQYLNGLMIFFVTAMIGCLPFVLQRVLGHPEAARRLGVFPIERMNILFLPGWGHYFVLGVLFICWGLLLDLLHRHYNNEEWIYCRDTIVLLLVFCFAGCFSLPVSGLILGKGIQLYHFADRFRRYFSFTVIIFLLYTMSFLPRYFSTILKRRKSTSMNNTSLQFSNILIFCVMLLSVLAIVREATALSQKSTHIRDEFEEYGSLPNYREDFLGVVNELLRRKHEGYQVICTFDHQLYAWWTTFEKGYAFLPDPWFFTGADSEIEYRLSAFCKLLNMSSEEFRTFITRDYINHFWLAHNKYKVSKMYTFSQISDYDPEDIHRKIEKAGLLGGELVIPISEQQRLVKQFEALENIPKHLELDLVVLTNDAFLKRFHPPEETFELSYENSTFRVWKRKADAAF